MWSSPEQVDGKEDLYKRDDDVVTKIKDIPKFWNSTKLPNIQNNATNDLITQLTRKYKFMQMLDSQ